MMVHEPATLLTDYLLTLLGGFFVWKLAKSDSRFHPAIQWWIRSFFLLALSSFWGGSYHGFEPNFSPWVEGIWWRSVLLLIALLGYSMAMALIGAVCPKPWQRILKTILLIKLAVVATVAMCVPEFFIVMIDYGSAMLAWLLVSLTTGRRWWIWIMGAVGLSAVAAGLQQSVGISAGWLNHNDLFHLVQAGSLYCFYRAALLSGDSEKERRRENSRLGPLTDLWRI